MKPSPARGSQPLGRAPRACAVVLGAVAATVGLTSRGVAFDAQLDADTSFQAYEVRSVGARAFHARRRLLSRLALTVSHELTEPDDEGRVVRISGAAQLRLQQDFGETCLLDRELCVRANDPDQPGAWQPLVADTTLDVPALWVQVDGLPGGFTARLGRQLLLDPIGFARVDGLSLQVAPVGWLRARATAGLLVRGTSVAGTPRSEMPGIVRLGQDSVPVPWSAPPVDTWVANVSLAGGPGRWLQLETIVRHMWEPGGEVLSRWAGRLSSQPADWLRFDGGGVLDLLTLDFIQAHARASVGDETLRLRAGVERHVPRFDPGSIWAWFTVAPVEQAELGVRWRASADLSLGGALKGRRAVLGEPYTDDFDGGVDAWFRARYAGFRFGGSGFLWSGALGPLAGASVDVTRALFSWLELALDVSVWHFQNPNRAGIHGTVLSEVLSVRVRPTRETTVLVDLQHATSRVVGHRFRAVLAVRVDTWR